jgi:adenosylcobinamide kinase / adenosylcobinamide-phosphate guanylyltransferase
MTRAGHVTFVLGGARSGKSGFAEGLMRDSGLHQHYIATGRAYDSEMEERIARHRIDRGEGWVTHEEPLRLAETLLTFAASDRAILVDCLTLWVTNLMMDEADIPLRSQELVDVLSTLPGRIVLVSNEVGLGIVPENRMARAFRDHAGRLHQAVAAIADEVHFIAAGLSLKMKG